MTIPPIHQDNPIEFAEIPEQALSIKLPANGRPAPNGLPRSVMFFAGYVQATIVLYFLMLYCLSPLMADAEWIKSWVKPIEPKLIAVLAIAIAIRPLVVNSSYSIFLVGLGTMTAIVSTTCSYWAASSLLSIAMVELICILGMEVGFHFYALATACDQTLSRTPVQTYRRFNKLTLTGFAALAIHLSLSSIASPLFSLSLLAVLGYVVGFHWLCLRERHPWAALKKAVAGFVFYPGETELAPGHVASPAGNYLSRAVLFGTTFATFVSIGFKSFHAEDTKTFLAWIVLSPALLLSVLTLVSGMVGSTIEVGSRIEAWSSIVRKMRNSANPIERNALLFGYVSADQSPVLVDRGLLFQHAHVLGATGTNKSSMGLAPLIDQLISFGDSSVIVIDLKSDSPELFYAAESAVRSLRIGMAKNIPLKVFSLENGTQSHLFNPFLTAGWTRLSILERTDIICTSCGLAYGFDYGRSFFTSSNSAVTRAANLLNPNAMSLRQLYQDVARLLEADSKILLPELRKAGVHASEVIGRLASYEQLNIVPQSGYDDEVIENQIQLADYFEKPGVVYFRLPSTTSSIGAPSVARLILYFLIIASKKSKRTTKVHVIIDEFQRMASENLDQMLQLARSHDIGLVLCNQSLSDLKANSPKVYQAVDGNCAIRQWFSATSHDDIDMLIKLMGTHEEIQVSKSYGKEVTTTYRSAHVPRARVTDIHKMSENRNLSIIQVGGSGRGYARYKGIPFMAFNDYHISPAEYAIRRKMDWPAGYPGMITTKEVFPEEPSRNSPRRTSKKDSFSRFDTENPEDLFNT